MLVTGLRYFGMPLEEIKNLTLIEYDLHLEAAQLQQLDRTREIHEMAWANQVVQATSANGKHAKFKKFSDFYDDSKRERKIKLQHANGRLIDDKQAKAIEQREQAKIVQRRFKEYFRKEGSDGKLFG
jgi:hypothetical protein